MHAFQEGNFIKRLDFEQAAPGDVLSKSGKIATGMKLISLGYISWWIFLTHFTIPSSFLHLPSFHLMDVSFIFPH
jgi:hypothetical protein